ncbi:MAG: hypothetical protein HQK76_06305 [Desulfobacterales bacterium]|nr:hypothetical protein [Desulfobacterales bacterium]
MLTDLNKFRNEMEDEGLFFCFCGPIFQELMIEIGKAVKQKMHIDEVNMPTAMKLFGVVVELSQNIIKYSSEGINNINSIEIGTELKIGTLMIGKKNDNFFVLAGNTMENEKVDNFKEKLIKLQKMNKDQLNEYYRSVRRKNVEEIQKGAGLGLIDIARKVNYPIHFEFNKINKEFSSFSIKINI